VWGAAQKMLNVEGKGSEYMPLFKKVYYIILIQVATKSNEPQSTHEIFFCLLHREEKTRVTEARRPVF